MKAIARLFSTVTRALLFRAKGMTRPLTPSERAFISQNETLWPSTGEQASRQHDKHVFVHHELYPLALLGNLHVASALAAEKQAGLILISPSWFDRAANRVLRSFPGVALEYRDSPRFLFFRVASYFKAHRALKYIRSPQDLLNFEFDGVLHGDTLYDTILAKGFASVREIKRPQVLPVLAAFFYHRAVTNFVLAKYQVVAGLSTHIVGTPGAVFLRNLVQRGIEVYIRETTLKKYTSLDMVHDCCATPDRRYIDYMKKRPEFFAALGAKALDNRLGNKFTSEIDHLAYKAEKKIYFDRTGFSRDFKLDPNKKNVFVMLHAFNDYPHTYGSMVHQDFYHWFLHVLEIAKKNKDVNWIFKNHPYEKYYPTEVDVGAIFASIDEDNIRYMPADVDFNTSSLKHVGDAVITCLGTAGLEYSAFGIPCILAARCWYSGLGFTREPVNRAEFEDELMNIANLRSLPPEQMVTAQVMAYFTFEAMNQLKFPDPFRTIATYDLDEAKTFTTDEMFDAILTYRAKSTAEEKQAYMDALYEFIRNPAWVQFVDFASHPHLKPALEARAQHSERENLLSAA